MAFYTKEELAAMDPTPRRLAMELMELEPEGVVDTVTTPTDDATHEASIDAIPSKEVESVASESQDDQEGDHPEEETKDVNYWMRRAEELSKKAENESKRASDSKRALTPALQKAAELEKTNSALEEKLAKLTELVESRFSDIQSKISTTHSDNSVVEIDEDEEYISENFPEFKRALEKTKEKAKKEAIAQVKDEFESRFKPVEESRAAIIKAAEDEKLRAHVSWHYSEVKSKHNDIDDFVFENGKLFPAFSAWAQSKPKFIQDVVSKATSYDPSDFSSVIEMFKSESGLNQKPKLAQGDIASKISNAPRSKAVVKTSKALTDREMANINNMIAKNAGNEKAISELLERYEYTLNQA